MPSAPKSEALAGDLYELLKEKLPVCRSEGGALQVAKLASRLGMTNEGVYRWLRADDISKRGRKRVVEIGSMPDNLKLLGDVEPMTEDDLLPFS